MIQKNGTMSAPSTLMRNPFSIKIPSSPSSSSKETDTGWDSGMDDFCDGNEDAAECKVFD